MHSQRPFSEMDEMAGGGDLNPKCAGSPPATRRRYFPGSDAIVVAPEQQEEADERSRARLAAAQSAITHPTSK